MKFREYLAFQNKLSTTPANLCEFFQQSTVESFFEKRSTTVGCKHVFTINKANVEVILQEFMLPARDDDEGSAEELSSGDRRMNVPELHCVVADDGAKVVSCYTVTIQNPLQFDYVVSLLGKGLSLRLISTVV